MNNPQQQHGTHTWDLILHYHQCPKCGYIIENRNKFEQRYHLLQKEVVCCRCQHTFTITKNKKPAFGPLLGHDPEIAD